MSISRLFAAAVLAVATATAQGWITVAVDTLTRNISEKSVGRQSLVADNSGTLHAVWTERTGNTPFRIVYRRRATDSTWSDPVVIAESTATLPALAVESISGTPHVVWCAPWGTRHDVFHAACRNGRWQITRLTSDTIDDFRPTVAVNPAGDAYVAWITRDSAGRWRIAFARQDSGTWRRQILYGSELGDFGSGAEPFIALSPDGGIHITYRGGNYPAYRVHHAESNGRRDTVWEYEVLATPNPADYSSAIAAGPDGELHTVITGNEGWGMPFHTYYLNRPAGSRIWQPARLMTADASAALRGFACSAGAVHITWERINGNINTEELYHCWRTPNGMFFNSTVRADGQTSGGAVALTAEQNGHCLIVAGRTPESSQVFCLHSRPFTGVAEPPSITRPEHHHSLVAPSTGFAPAAGSIIDPLGRLVLKLPAETNATTDRPLGADRLIPAGVYFVVTKNEVRRLCIVR